MQESAILQPTDEDLGSPTPENQKGKKDKTYATELPVKQRKPKSTGKHGGRRHNMARQGNRR